MTTRERIATWPQARANRYSNRVVETLAAHRTMTIGEIDRFQSFAFDPGGAVRNLILPTEASSKGVMLMVSNEADVAGEIITIQNDAAAAIKSLNMDEAALIWCDGVSWYGMVAPSTRGSVVVAEVVVDASAGGTATETAIITVPANSILLDVIAYATVAFDGDTTQTLEVGLTGNIDKYIDTTDFDPASVDTQASSNGGTTNDQKTSEWLKAATAIVATWTNTANMTVGSTTVYVIYVPLA